MTPPPEIDVGYTDPDQVSVVSAIMSPTCWGLTAKVLSPVAALLAKEPTAEMVAALGTVRGLLG